MKQHNTDRVTGLFDGQLTGVRRWWVQRHVNRCVLCANEFRHQHHVREMLKANPPLVEMSDSAEFFWSKVKREIQARGNNSVRIPVPSLSFGDWAGQHVFAVAGIAVSVVVLLGILGLAQNRRRDSLVLAGCVPQVEHVSTMMPNTVATPYEVPKSNVTVIWVSGLPWTPDITEMQTEFARTES